MINFDAIEPDIFVGSAPASSVDIARIKQLKVSAVLSLQSDGDFRTHRIDWASLQKAYQYQNILVQRYPIQDFDEVDLGEKVAQPIMALHNLLNDGHRVYVHCNAGICRAPATVLGYLCHYRGMDVEQGLHYIRRNRPKANPYLRAVRRALSELNRD